MQKISDLRALMKERNLDGYIIPSGDAHASEYMSSYWRVRAWISGFTGSAGILVVTHDKAGLWTDGRYHIQAARELEGTGIDLFKDGERDVPTHLKFLADNLPLGGKLGFDGRTTSANEFKNIKNALKDKAITYAYEEDLAGQLWKDRPPMPTAKAFEHEPQFAGLAAAGKLAKVRDKMKEKGFSAYLVAPLDEIAWLLNIRGFDVPNLPVVYAFVLITENEAHVFIDPDKITDISVKLAAQGFTLHDYNALPEFLSKLTGSKLYYNGLKTNMLITEAVSEGITTESKPIYDIIPMLKAVKSQEEIANIKNAFIKESVVLVKMLKWLDEAVKADSVQKLKEGDIARKLEELRKQQPHFLFDSFATIPAYGPNAAQAHYSPDTDGAQLKADGFLLVDTGGQYLDGTTDTTRTITIGPLTDEMKRDFTLVLQGHIAIARAEFLSGTTGSALDILARLPLWQDGQNYRHGTGHGLGYCLSVHEGPHGITPRHNPVALAPGMLISNEPGIYKEGRYGIRTESIVLVVNKQKNSDGEFLALETITHCPIDLNAIMAEMLTPVERDWLNNYHATTYETLSPHLNDDEREWLKQATRPI